MLKQLLTITILGMFALHCGAKEQTVRYSGGNPRLNAQNHLAQIQKLDGELKSSRSDEEKGKILSQKGKLFLELGRYEDAISALGETLTLRTPPVNQSEINLNLGKAYIGKNEYGKAIQYLNQAERSDKNFNPEERKKLVVQSLVAEKEFYPALAALSKNYHKGNQKKDNFYYETAAKTYLKMGFEYKNLGFYKKSYQVASLGLQEYPENETLRSIQKDCIEVLQPEGKL